MKQLNEERNNSRRDIAPDQPSPGENARWVVFSLDAHRYALPLAAVERVVRAAQVTPLPLAPPVVLGALDVAGNVLPVFNLRGRFQLPDRAVSPDDQFLLARAPHRTVALWIDSAVGVIERPLASIVASATLVPHLAHIRGVVPLEDGLLFIQDLEQFLSPEEASALDHALHEAGSAHGG